MFSIPSAPAKQSVSDTINVLSGRLGSATLLEDRRAAILGLRSFAKAYPASVASGALRSLIGSLAKDGEDVDTVKVVLETLLMLFSPNEDSPEASDEIALWLADEFTQRQENITLLLDFLDSTDFYARLYSMQLVAAILSARTERTEECVFTAPLGISRLVAVLDDQREAVRNEAVGLLTILTPTSIDIQKLVAFENAFERLFAIIEADGSLSEGGRAVEDCLILLANLLRRNMSNQSLFRESGCVNRLADLLDRLLKAQDQEPDLAAWAQTQRGRNVYAFLAIVRLFLTPGSVGTPQNQGAFWKHGLVYHVLQLAFSHDTEAQIKGEALITCGDMMRDNSALQEGFAQLMVPAPMERRVPDVAEKANGHAKVYVIDGLLDVILNMQDLSVFDVRFAACECLKAYLSKHAEVRLHFLSRAIEGYQAESDESANVFTVLLRPSTDPPAGDPYRQWFAAVIAFHLLHDSPAAKAKALQLTEGDASNGEEVVTSMQTIAAHLVTGIARDDDARVLVGYLMLLLAWLFEDLDAVNDFLTEGSNVQSLIQAVSRPHVAGGDVVQGLCAMVLGVAYEFSTKDSPIPRATLHSILTTRLDRDRYLDRLIKLRSHPLLRDFEVTPQRLSSSMPGRLPDVFFDADFVNFFKDNYSRVARAIDREPGMEISVVKNGVQKGISRELVDSLRGQVEEKDRTLQDAKAAMATLERQISQEQAEHRRSREEAAVETSKAKLASESTQRSHEAELRKLQSQHAAKVADQDREVVRLQGQLTAIAADHEKKLAQTRKTVEADAERIQRRTEAEVADLRATISRLEVDVMKANKSKAQELQAMKAEHARLITEQTSKVRQGEERSTELENQLDEIRAAREDMRARIVKAESALTDAIAARESTQSELDDLLLVFGDLEEKAARYKTRLRELGETVSDGEDDDSDDNENDGDDDDVD